MSFTEFTCRSGGNNLYAGSLDGSAEASTTPLVTYTNGGWNSGTGVFTPASGNPVSAGVAVGNWVSVYTDGASAPTGFVARVTAVSSTTITLSTTAKSGTAPTTAGTGITAVVGGAWVGPNGASGFPFNFAAVGMTDSTGNPLRVNLKSDQTYSISSAISSTNSASICFEGYTTTFGDSGISTIDGGTSGASYTLLSVADRILLRSLKFQNNGATGSASGVTAGGFGTSFQRCVFTAVRGHGLQITGGASYVEECEAYACNQSNTSSLGGFAATGGSAMGGFFGCISHDNSGSNNNGFVFSNTAMTCSNCIADTNGAVGFTFANSISYLMANISAYNNSSHGVLLNSNPMCATLRNCLLVSNGGYGVSGPVSGNIRLNNCAFYSNTSGQTTGLAVQNVGAVTLSGNPFVDAPNGDFDLNSTAGAGAACRGAGRGNFLQTAASYAGTLSVPDIGASQHPDSGGSAGMLYIPNMEGV